MATINLGAIKFNWKGPYNNGTTYAVDDVVSSGVEFLSARTLVMELFSIGARSKARVGRNFGHVTVTEFPGVRLSG